MDNCPVIDFDHHFTPNENPISVLDELRQEYPVAYSTRHGGYWVVTGAADVRRVMQDPGTFSSARDDEAPELLRTILPAVPRHFLIPEELDPPAGIPFKKMTARIVSPNAVHRAVPLLERWTRFFMDELVERGSCDIVSEFASPVPACVTLELLGLPTTRWRDLGRAMHDLSASPQGSPRRAQAEQDYLWIQGMIEDTVRARVREPREDAISNLAEQEVDGRRVTEDEMQAMVSILVHGGVETTSTLIGSTAVHLAEHPDDRRRLVAEPDLLPLATEEFLRFYPPSIGHARTVTREVSVGGFQMKAGDRVWACWASANRDSAMFPDADSFVIDRTPNTHHSFAVGPHRCTGSHLARRLFMIMTRELLDRLPDYRLAVPASELDVFPDRHNFNGYDSVPIVFTPGTRRGSWAPDDERGSFAHSR
jgi:cytochrome P450